MERAGKGLLGGIKKRKLSKIFHDLRTWDAEAADRPDVLLANSEEVKRRIELYWRRESEVVNPPIEDFWFEKDLRPATCDLSPFLIVSTLTSYKNIDIAIKACNQLELPLTIVGEGPDKKRLKKMAGPTIKFLGYKSNEEVRDLYTESKAVLFTCNDDFGLVPLEANACGTPVIAIDKGGAKETVIDGETGIFFNESTSDSLIEGIHRFTKMNFDSETCINHAKGFKREVFEKKILEIINL
ncbi:glycosyltransferase [Candidatus Peregrinibacteria bacterium]|nr:glycosyltransferase [Candidatus Peregrinibacteria bacterium]